MPTDTHTTRAFGVIRVSRAKDDARSPGDQRRRITEHCERDGLELVDVAEELDVSGGRPLDKRPGLLHAVEAVEAGAADVVIVAYFDRLVRSLKVQAEVVERIEAAGGRVLTLDVGEISNGSAAQWLSGTFLGAVNEYHRRTTAEKTADGKRDAVARGVAPFARIPPGIRRGGGRRLEQDPELAPVMAEAFRLRANGAAIEQVRGFLGGNGVKISHAGLTKVLGNRLYLGELRFGQWQNLEAFPPVVDPDTFRRVQQVRVSKGRYAKSERLLARLGVLRCSGCGGRMVVHTRRYQAGRVPTERTFYQYRCPAKRSDCPQGVAIGAVLAEQIVADATKQVLAAAHGEHTVGDRIAAAELERDRAEAELAVAVENLATIPGSHAKLLELKEAVDMAADTLEQLRAAAGPGLSITVADWDDFTTEQRRRLIRLAITSAVVQPGRAGPGRIKITSATGEAVTVE